MQKRWRESCVRYMVYKVVITFAAEEDFINVFNYIYYQLENPLAAGSFARDYIDAIKRLSSLADGMQVCENEELANRGYRVIHLKKHRYKLLYKIDNDKAVVVSILHNLQQMRAPKV